MRFLSGDKCLDNHVKYEYLYITGTIHLKRDKWQHDYRLGCVNGSAQGCICNYINWYWYNISYMSKQPSGSRIGEMCLIKTKGHTYYRCYIISFHSFDRGYAIKWTFRSHFRNAGLRFRNESALFLLLILLNRIEHSNISSSTYSSVCITC